MRHALPFALAAALGLGLASPAPVAAAKEKCLRSGDKVSGRLTLVKTGEKTFAAVLVTKWPVCAWVASPQGEAQLRGRKLLLAFDEAAPRVPVNSNTVATVTGAFAAPIPNFPGDLALLHAKVLRVMETDAPPPAPPSFKMAKPGAFDSAN